MSLLAPLPLHADTAAGLAWLLTQQQAVGSFTRATDSATPLQSSAEVARALVRLGQRNHPGVVPLAGFLSTAPRPSVETLARVMVAQRSLERDVAALLPELLAMGNADGGWGDMLGYASNPLDSGMALEALGLAGVSPNETLSTLIGWLLSTQQADGGWQLDANPSGIEITAQVMRGLFTYRQDYADLDAALSRARAFVVSQQTAAGGWGDDDRTALALITLIPQLTDLSPLASGAERLRAHQLADGSWGGDVYTTALALSALALYDARSGGNPPGQGSLTGITRLASTGEPLAGVTLQLDTTPAQSLTSATDGRFLSTDLTPGRYTLQASKTGYLGLSQVVDIQAGQVTDVGVITLGLANQDAVLRVETYHHQTLAPLAGVNVQVSGGTNPQSLTDSLGAVEFVLPAGGYTLTSTLFIRPLA